MIFMQQDKQAFERKQAILEYKQRNTLIGVFAATIQKKEVLDALKVDIEKCSELLCDMLGTATKKSTADASDDIAQKGKALNILAERGSYTSLQDILSAIQTTTGM